MKTIFAHKPLTFIVLAAVLAIAAVSIGIASRPAGIPVTGIEQPQVYGNALELQYAEPWLAEQNRPAYTHALELEYAKPWLQNGRQYGNALEMQYAAPWLQADAIDCNSSLDLLYACQYGLGK